jgi:hypothetical protein
MSGSLALPLKCSHCGGAVTLVATDAGRDQVLDQGWLCPHCLMENRFSVPWRTAWALERTGRTRSRLVDPATLELMQDFALWTAWVLALGATVATGHLVVGMVAIAAELLLVDTLAVASSLGVGVSQLESGR